MDVAARVEGVAAEMGGRWGQGRLHSTHHEPPWARLSGVSVVSPVNASAMRGRFHRVTSNRRHWTLMFNFTPPSL